MLFEVDVQRASGSFHLDFLGGFTNAYHNVSNILVRIAKDSNTLAKGSVLLASHYDSALGTAAATDAAAQVHEGTTAAARSE